MGKYDDIINLPHHISQAHPQMSLHDRAAQFSPFAALTGHEDAIAETARITDERLEIGESKKIELDMKIAFLHSLNMPEISVTYFVPDSLKEGGAYITHCERLKKVDTVSRALLFCDGSTISIDDIFDIEGSVFETGE